MKILIVDDDTDLIEVMTYALRREGYDVLGATDGLQALERIRADFPDIVILDVRMPRLDGFETCRRIRHISDVPIIMLTARGEEHDVLRGLQVGADDYMTKPFSLKQLAARVGTILRRCRGDQFRRVASEVRAGDLVLRLQSYEALRDGVPVQLTPLEFRILYLLAMNEGQIIPYTRLVDYAWGYEGGDSSLLKTHICHIRRKLNLPLEGPGAIRSLATVGYSLAKQRTESSTERETEPIPVRSTEAGPEFDDAHRERAARAESASRRGVTRSGCGARPGATAEGAAQEQGRVFVRSTNRTTRRHATSMAPRSED